MTDQDHSVDLTRPNRRSVRSMPALLLTPTSP